jgi:hypothetical protein
MRKILIILCLIIPTITVAACGGQTDQTTPMPVPVTNTPGLSPLATNTSTPAPADTSTAQAPTQAITSVSFANDVFPIFENYCTKCHGVEQIKEGLDMRTYDGLMVGSFNGPVITPGNANDSFLVEQILKGKMPKRGPKPTTEQIQIIINWINAGALNN